MSGDILCLVNTFVGLDNNSTGCLSVPGYERVKYHISIVISFPVIVLLVLCQLSNQ